MHGLEVRGLWAKVLVGASAVALASGCGDEASGGLMGSTGDEPGASSQATPSSGGVDSTGVDPSADSGSTGEGPGGCREDAECSDPSLPFCVQGVCVSCDQASADACSARDPGAPVCAGVTCVECRAAADALCGGTTPVCDDPAGVCTGCSGHAECGDAACDFTTGACLDAMVVEVDLYDAACSDRGPVFCTVPQAAATVPAGVGATILIHEGITAVYGGTVVDRGRTIAFMPWPGEHPGVIGTGGDQTFVAASGGVVILEGLDLTGNRNGGGLVVDGGHMIVDHCDVGDNDDTEIVVNSGELWLRNSFVWTPQSSIQTPMHVLGGTVELLYTSVVDRYGDAIVCEPGAQVIARNSIITNTGTNDEIVCPGLTATHSASRTALTGDGNVVLPEDTELLFVAGQINPMDLHLTVAGARLLGAAGVWQAGDPPDDYDGDPRPTEAGAPDAIGADRP
ncbi:MAG: hypothetical protein K0V04_38470 [Deltaproteobacteria bacterium]|nr:hypothetical protein [Deltaproteobacteria bacterium]